jgi:hypothetical protein
MVSLDTPDASPEFRTLIKSFFASPRQRQFASPGLGSPMVQSFVLLWHGWWALQLACQNQFTSTSIYMVCSLVTLLDDKAIVKLILTHIMRLIIGSSAEDN